MAGYLMFGFEEEATKDDFKAWMIDEGVEMFNDWMLARYDYVKDLRFWHKDRIDYIKVGKDNAV